MRIRNVHRRRIAASLSRAGALLDSLAGPDDRLWPHDRWPPMRLDRPLAIGACGGHGPVYYRVSAYSPGCRVAFDFDPARGLMRGLRGHHAFELSEDCDEVVLEHVLEAEGSLRDALRWFLMVRPLHDALIEDALDRADCALVGNTPPPERWSRWVLLLRWLARRRKR